MKNNENMITKPITILREEFVDNILTLCNSSGLPFFVIEDILKSLIPEIHSLSLKQYKADRENYELLCKRIESESENLGKDGA